MKKPHKTVIAIDAIGMISKIEIIRGWTDSDVTEDCVITGTKGQVKGRWSTYEEFLELRVWNGYLARLKPQYRKALHEWERLRAENQQLVADHERIKRELAERGIEL